MKKRKLIGIISYLMAAAMVTASIYTPAFAQETEGAVEEERAPGAEESVLQGVPSDWILDAYGSGFCFTADAFEPAVLVGYVGDSWNDLTVPATVYDGNTMNEYKIYRIGAGIFDGNESNVTGTLTIEGSGSDSFGEEVTIEDGAFSGCANVTTIVLEKGLTWTYPCDGCTGVTRVINENSYDFKLDRLGTEAAWHDKNGNVIDRIASGTAYSDKYVAQKHRVTFETDGGSGVTAQEVEDGEKAEKPFDPQKNDYIFAGWYEDAQLTKVYDFNTAVTADITLYAKWTQEAGSGKQYPDKTNHDLYFTINEDGATATIVRKEGDVFDGAYYLINEDLVIPAKVQKAIGSDTETEYTVTAIGNDAFAQKGYMGSLIIPDTVTSIGEKAFYECSDLSGDIVLPEGLEEIGKEAFAGCGSFSGALNLGQSLKVIGDSAFENCSGLNGDLVFPDTVESVGDYAFCGCLGFDGKLYLGKNLISVGAGAFLGDRNLMTFNHYTGDLEIPEGVTSIGEYAFHNSKSLDGKLTMGKKVVTIGKNAFGYCEKLTGELTLPDTLLKIEDGAFRGCKGLTGNLVIPDSVTSIGGSAFSDCSGFSYKLTIGEGVEVVDKTMISGALFTESSFSGCTGITRVDVKSEKVEVDLSGMLKENSQKWMDANGATIQSIGKGTAYRSDYEGDKEPETPNDPDNPDPDNPSDGALVNKPSSAGSVNISVPGVDGEKVTVTYYRKIPFFGKAKPDLSSFGGAMIVTIKGKNYNVSKIKVNTKLKRIQIKKVDGVDKTVSKAIDKATKGNGGLAFQTTPYVVSDKDDVKPKFKKDGSLVSAKVKISGKYVKFKSTGLKYNASLGVITFSSSDVIGSYKAKP